MVKVAERSQKLVSEFARNQMNGGQSGLPPELAETGRARSVADAFMALLTNLASNQKRVMQAQHALLSSYLDLWQSMTKRLLGETAGPVIEPARGDKRFRGEEWTSNVVFDYIKQSYLLTANWLLDTVRDVEGLDPHQARLVEFHTRQFVDAISPSNFVLTNPEILRTTLEENGENLVRGLENLLGDLERGHGKLAIRMTDMEAFEIGQNIAVTPGKVVYENALMQLIQYTPTTDTVYARPLVIFPPWINKFYILDLTQEKSFIRWAVSKGYTVFVVSWVNPDEKLARKTFESYMTEGVYAALDAIEEATGMREVNAIGYCIGGTLLGSSLAHMAARGDDRIRSATFFAAQMDFSEAGELDVFIDEPQLQDLERKMDSAGGYLAANEMAHMFNTLRSNDLIWSFVINNYLLGKDPAPFDLLYWNSDQTNMPKQMHLFYLRECYLENNLARGRMKLGGETLDLHKVKIPVYLQSSQDDHIAPYRSVYKATRLFGGKNRFIIAGSGHIAGVINPPSARKYCHWTNDALPDDVEQWFDEATQHPGSWWDDWHKWQSRKSGRKVPARQPGDGKLPVIEDAPGRYVKVKGT